MSASIDLSIVVVNYKGGSLVERCIASMFEQPIEPRFEVIVIGSRLACGRAFSVLTNSIGVEDASASVDELT